MQTAKTAAPAQPPSIMDFHKPWYASKKLLAYGATLVTVPVLVYLHAETPIIEHLATAIALGLPVLLGMQGWADRDAVGMVGKGPGVSSEAEPPAA